MTPRGAFGLEPIPCDICVTPTLCERTAFCPWREADRRDEISMPTTVADKPWEANENMPNSLGRDG
jgi:hypothetical protein